MLLRTLGVSLLLGAVASTAGAQSIGLYFDAASTVTRTQQSVGTSGTLYVVAKFPSTMTGFTGAEFTVLCFPEEWPRTVTAHRDANIVLGNPLTNGVNIVFPLCQNGWPTTGVVRLFTIGYFATTAVSNLCVGVIEHLFPRNPLFPCPLVTLCDFPNFTKTCVAGGVAVFNPTDPPCAAPLCKVTIGVENTTWSVAKALYR